MSLIEFEIMKKKIPRAIGIFSHTILSSYKEITALHFLNFAVFFHIKDTILSHEKKVAGTFESQCISKNT